MNFKLPSPHHMDCGEKIYIEAQLKQAIQHYIDSQPAKPTAIETRLIRELRYIAGISTGQVKRVADQALEDISEDKPANGEREALIAKLRAIACATPGWDEMLNSASDMLAAASTPPQAERVPMTPQELDDLMPTNDSMSRYDALRWVARATERKHGITGATE